MKGFSISANSFLAKYDWKPIFPSDGKGNKNEKRRENYQTSSR